MLNTILPYLNLGLTVLLVSLTLVNGYLILRSRRLFAILLVLDDLLMDLACRSAADHHRAIYAAWDRTMGRIEVQVRAGRYHWDRGESQEAEF